MLICLSAIQGAWAQTDADQQQKDQDTKSRIYGTKHPWENVLPYGTQYTPPQSGAGSGGDDSTAEPAKAKQPVKKARAAKVKKKVATHKAAVKKPVAKIETKKQ